MTLNPNQNATMAPDYGAARERTGAFLRSCRDDAGISQGQMAERLGVSQATVSGWEKGTRKIEGDPSPAYGIEPSYFAAPLDPELRRAYFVERNALLRSVGSKDAGTKARKAQR